jgi:ribonuclease Z
MAEIFFLGTGGSVATPQRDNTSFLFRSGAGLHLVDCPGGVIQKIKKLGFRPRDVRTIFLTHIHPDHVYGLPSFIHSLMLEEGEVTVLGSKETVDFCGAFLDLFKLREAKVRFRVRFLSLGEGQSWETGRNLTALPFRTEHHPSSLAFQFVLNKERKSIFYSGDTPARLGLVQKANSADVLIHDCSAPSRFFKRYPSLRAVHTDSLRLGELASESGIRFLLPCHFFGEVNFALSEIETEIRRSFTGRLLCPADFDRIPV